MSEIGKSLVNQPDGHEIDDENTTQNPQMTHVYRLDPCFRKTSEGKLGLRAPAGKICGG
jgi:hypothetical protein